MKNICKKLGVILVTVLMLAGGIAGISAEASEVTAVSWPTGPEISSPCAIVMEANTGTVLYEKNADEQHYPASITKILTTLLAIENCPLDEVVTFSADAVFKNEGDSSHIARDLDEQMTLEQCLYGVMLESANECAYAVAEHVGGGDYQKFVDLMNEKAVELGCTNTHFTNANGLPDEEHVTTCRDMALISRAAIENSTFRQIAGTVKYTIPPTNKHADETPLNNHHQMISAYKGRKHLYEYCIGGKTGYTVAAGSTLVTYAEKDDMLLICVIMNSSNTHYQDTRTLFDYCFSNYKMYNVAQNETRYDSSQGSGASLFSEIEPFAKLDTEAEIILPVDADFADTHTEISYDNATGNVVGSLVYTYGGKQVGTADVLTTGASAATYEFGKKAASEAEFGSADEEMTDTESDSSKPGLLESIQSNHAILKIVIVVIIIAAVLILGLFLYNNIRRYVRRKRKKDRRYKVIKQNRKWRRRR